MTSGAVVTSPHDPEQWQHVGMVQSEPGFKLGLPIRGLHDKRVKIISTNTLTSSPFIHGSPSKEGNQKKEAHSFEGRKMQFLLAAQHPPSPLYNYVPSLGRHFAPH